MYLCSFEKTSLLNSVLKATSSQNCFRHGWRIELKTFWLNMLFEAIRGEVSPQQFLLPLTFPGITKQNASVIFPGVFSIM